MIVTVERVGKFGPMVDGKWMGIKKPLKATDFVAGQSYDIEQEPWSANGKSGVNIVSVRPANAVEPVKQVTKTVSESKAVTATVSNYNENKDRRILVQGVTQAVAASPSLAGLPYTNTTELVANIKAVAKELIEFVLEETAK